MKVFFLFLFLFIFVPFNFVKADNVIYNKSGGPLFIFLVDKNCHPDPIMLKKLMFSMPTDPDFYFAINCSKLGKTLELEPSKSLSIKEPDEFIFIAKLKSPVSKVSFCYLRNSSEVEIQPLGIGGVTCKCISSNNCINKLKKE